jgi:signal transduction histidine kinase
VKPYQLAIDVSVAAIAVLLRSFIGYDSIVMMIVVLGMGAVVAVHRVSPTLALAGAWATVILQLSFGLPPDLSNAAVLVMLFATAAYGTPVIKWLGLISTGVGSFVATLYLLGQGIVTSTDWSDFAREILGNLPRYSAIFVGGFTAGLALFVLCWSLGLLMRSLRTTRESRLAQAAAEAEQLDAQRDVAIEQERNRIARDMHDVVAHSLAVVIAQADGARYAMRADPDSADAALGTISSTAREALGDVRILLGQLRHRQGEGPKPSLVDLDRLFEQMRASGLGIQRVDSGEPEPLGTTQQLAVYRIVQESLTNALRHGDTAQDVVVTFAWGAGTLTISISSALGSAPHDKRKAGHGIDGMRERAILAGGNFFAGERDGRFVVSSTMAVVATLPIQVVRA